MKRKNNNILVTGGAGFIGSHLVDKLVEDNDVLVVDDFSIGTADRLKNAKKSGRLRIVRGDIRNTSAMYALTKGIDILYHLAARCVRISINDPYSVHDVNATGSLHLYMAARKNNVGRVVHVSSSEVYGTAYSVPMKESHPLQPETIYGASKLAGELYGLAYYRTYGLSVTVVRPFNTYGPRSHFKGPYGEVIPRFVVRALNNLPPIIYGDGSYTRDFTYVEDIVAGLVLVGSGTKLAGEVVNIAYGKERTIREVAQIVLSQLGKTKLGVIHRDKRPGDVKRHYADVRKAKKLLEFRPTTALEEGISRYIYWFKDQNIDVKKALSQVADTNW